VVKKESRNALLIVLFTGWLPDRREGGFELHVKWRQGRYIPSGEMVAISIIALSFSLVTLAILVWDKFLRRAKFDVQADWIISASEPVLRFAVLNTGYRKSVVRDIRLRSQNMPVGEGWTPYNAVMSKLPLVLDADDASEAFLVQPAAPRDDAFEDALRAGRIDAIDLENGRGQVSTFRLPDLRQAKRDAEGNPAQATP
jgi:hypothetical protein